MGSICSSEWLRWSAATSHPLTEELRGKSGHQGHPKSWIWVYLGWSVYIHGIPWLLLWQLLWYVPPTAFSSRRCRIILSRRSWSTSTGLHSSRLLGCLRWVNGGDACVACVVFGCFWMFVGLIIPWRIMKRWKHMKNTWTNPTWLLVCPAECVYFLMSPVVSGTVPPPKLHGGLPWRSTSCVGSTPTVTILYIFKAQIRNLESSFEHSVGPRKWGSGKSQAHWYSAWSRKCRVWQCRTMYDNVWYVNSSHPHELII